MRLPRVAVESAADALGGAQCWFTNRISSFRTLWDGHKLGKRGGSELYPPTGSAKHGRAQHAIAIGTKIQPLILATIRTPELSKSPETRAHNSLCLLSCP